MIRGQILKLGIRKDGQLWAGGRYSSVGMKVAWCIRRWGERVRREWPILRYVSMISWLLVCWLDEFQGIGVFLSWASLFPVNCSFSQLANQWCRMVLLMCEKRSRPDGSNDLSKVGCWEAYLAALSTISLPGIALCPGSRPRWRRLVWKPKSMFPRGFVCVIWVGEK